MTKCNSTFLIFQYQDEVSCCRITRSLLYGGDGPREFGVRLWRQRAKRRWIRIRWSVDVDRSVFPFLTPVR